MAACRQDEAKDIKTGDERSAGAARDLDDVMAYRHTYLCLPPFPAIAALRSPLAYSPHSVTASSRSKQDHLMAPPHDILGRLPEPDWKAKLESERANLLFGQSVK